MATPEEQRRAQLDARYKAKLAARASGEAPVFESDPALDTSGRNPEDIDARYRAKLARHSKPAPVAPEAKPEQGDAAKGKESKGQKPDDKKPEAKPEQGDAKR